MWYNPKKSHPNLQSSKDEERDGDKEMLQFGLWRVDKQASLSFLPIKTQSRLLKAKTSLIFTFALRTRFTYLRYSFLEEIM